MLPILLGASVGQTGKVRPAMIALGFVMSFSMVALLLSAITRAFDFDPNVLRTGAAVVLLGFGLLMIWPVPFEWLSGRIGGFEGRGSFAQIGGVSILKPKPLGGITAYDLNTGDKIWWSSNGGMIPVKSDSPLFAEVPLPPAPGRGMAQVMTTKTLVIYGTGRSGGPPDAKPMLYAVDKATGKQVGAVEIPSRTTAVPMTFMHQGKQYIVFATGAGETSLVALRLP